MSQSGIKNSILDVIERHLKRWVEQDIVSRLVIARQSFDELSKVALPDGVRVTRKPLRGRRRAVQARRHGNSYHVVARWPEDRLESVRIPLAVCVIKGPVDLQLGDYILHCDTGHLVLVPPGVLLPSNVTLSNTAELANDEKICDVLCLCPWSSGAGGLQCWIAHTNRLESKRLASPDEECYVPNPHTAQYFNTLVEEVLTAQSEFSEENKRIHQNLLALLVTTLERDLKGGHYFRLGGRALDMPSTEGSSVPISQAQEYICAHLRQGLTIEKVSSAVYISRAQFTRRFKQETGKTFIEFVTEQRLNEAQRLLRETDWSVQTIAELVGLKPSHLRELFRAHVKASPQQFRSLSRTPKG